MAGFCIGQTMCKRLDENLKYRTCTIEFDQVLDFGPQCLSARTWNFQYLHACPSMATMICIDFSHYLVNRMVGSSNEVPYTLADWVAKEGS